MNSKDIYALARHIKRNIKGIYLTGSIRRLEKEPKDIDIITKRPFWSLLVNFNSLYDIKFDIDYKEGEHYMEFDIGTNDNKDKYRINIWYCPDDYTYKFHKWLLDMDKGHNIYYRKQAKKYGYKLSINGLKNIESNAFKDVDTKTDLKRIIHIKL